MTRMPTYFINHGGGPWPWVPEMRSRHAVLESALAAMPDDLPQTPEAVLVVSGHWEAEHFLVMQAERPAMLYDYRGFPRHTYEISYPAPGAPDLAKRTANLIAAAGLPSGLDAARGFDHGTFVPMHVMFPDATVPLFQVSIRADYDPAAHLALGRALAPLRDDGVLIVGSGLSYHNLRQMGPTAAAPSASFDAWLSTALDAAPETRTQAMLDWEAAPAARVAHAEEDHLVPLWVALGAAEGETATRVYHQPDFLGSVTASSWRFG